MIEQETDKRFLEKHQQHHLWCLIEQRFNRLEKQLGDALKRIEQYEGTQRDPKLDRLTHKLAGPTEALQKSVEANQ